MSITMFGILDGRSVLFISFYCLGICSFGVTRTDDFVTIGHFVVLLISDLVSCNCWQKNDAGNGEGGASEASPCIVRRHAAC